MHGVDGEVNEVHETHARIVGRTYRITPLLQVDSHD